MESDLVVKSCSNGKFESILELLKKLTANSCHLQRHGACLMKKKKIFALGVNKYYQVKPIANSKKPVYLSIHAEIDALASTNGNISGLDILIIRMGKNNQLQYSRPCNACIDKLQQKGIRRAYYSDTHGAIVYENVENMPKLHVSSGHRFRIQCNEQH
jgi:deoxycytidylate deaminase